MPHADNSLPQKLATIVFVGVWAAVTLGLAFESIAVVEPPFYGLFTAIVFLLVGRMWNLEVERLLPVPGSEHDSDQRDDE